MNAFRNEDGTANLGNILGIAMIVTGVIELLIQCIWFDFSDFMSDDLPDLISYASFIVGGSLILATRPWKHATRMSFAGIIMGLALLISNVTFFNVETDRWFLISMISFFLGIVMIFFSIGLMFGYSLYSVKVTVCAAIMSGIEAYPIYDTWRMEYTMEHLISAYGTYLNRIPITGLCVVFLIGMYREVIKVVPPTKRIDRDLRAVSDILYSRDDSYITPYDLQTILDYCDDELRCDRSLCIPLRTENTEYWRRLIVRYIGNNQEPVAYVAPSNGKSFIQGFRFNLMHVVVSENRDKIRIYGKHGVFVEIMVKEYEHVKNLKDVYTARIQQRDE